MNTTIDHVTGEEALPALDEGSRLADNSVAKGAIILIMVLFGAGALAVAANTFLGDSEESGVKKADGKRALSSVPLKTFATNEYEIETAETAPEQETVVEVVVEQAEPTVPAISDYFNSPPPLLSQTATAAPLPEPEKPIPELSIDKSGSKLMVATNLPVLPEESVQKRQDANNGYVEVPAQYQPPQTQNNNGVITVTDEFGSPANQQNTAYPDVFNQGATRRQTGVATIATRRVNKFVLSMGSYIDCVLNTQLNSQIAGLTKCQVLHNVYSDSGDVLLIERGSVMTGEYRAVTMQGINRIIVRWTRIRTPDDVLIDVDSPATDSLGGTGIPGFLDNQIWKRFGGAFMLSLIQDGLEAAKANNGVVTRTGTDDEATSATEESTGQIVEAILTLYANIQPTVEVDRGSRVGVLIAKDLDFSEVYSVVNQ